MTCSASSASPLRRSRTSAPSPVRFSADVVRRLLDVDREVEPHGAENLLNEVDDLRVEIGAHDDPLRLRGAGLTRRLRDRHGDGRRTGANDVVRQVLLADREDVADEPVDHQPAGTQRNEP